MTRFFGTFLTCLTAGLGFFASAAVAEEAEDPRLAHEGRWKPFLAEHCFGCHGSEKQKAGLNLEDLLGNEPPRIEDRGEWETVLEILMAREMPPEKSRQPSEALRQEMVDYIAARLETFDCSGPVNPGSVTVRRLNRVEYQNTIRDLVDVDFEATERFPRDEVGYGFDHIGDVLSLSPLLMEKYLEAAEEVVDAAVLSKVLEWPPARRFEESEMKRVGEGDDARIVRQRYLGLYREAAGEVRFRAPTAGRYQVRVRAYQDKAGPEPAKMRVTVGGKVLAETEVTAEAGEPLVFRWPVSLEEGEVAISAAYTNNYVNNDSRDPALRGDRNLYLDFIEVIGPLDVPRPPLPATHVALIARQPEPGGERALVEEIFSRFMLRAYRRPANEDEHRRVTDLVMGVLNDGIRFEESVKVGLMAVLVSPHFLYRWELDQGRVGGGEEVSEPRTLDGYELASRLSYFLWSSMPDDVLLESAARNDLSDPSVLRSELKRMLADPKAEALVSNFTGQWLQTRNLASVKPDPETFPEFDEALREAMRKETELFVQSIVDQDESVLRLLDADYTFLNERLAGHYGIEGVQGESFRRVSLEPTSRRGGVLTQASVLTITSEPTRTSPVIRGKWVLEQILGTPPPPPPDVEPLEESKEAHESASLRERLEQHRDHPDCAGCHAKMDPIGFALENYDAIGRWRDADGDFPIDASSELTGGIEVSGPADLKRVLVEKEDFVWTLCENMLIYALGRGTEYYDKCSVDLVVDQLRAGGYRFSTLIEAIVMSDPFLKRQPNPSTS